MITIHEKNTTTFENLGLGVLFPSFCIVKEELNGIFELELEHSYDDFGKWKYIENDRILYASTPRGKQPFRIYKINPTMSGITVYAHHIFYDLLDNFIVSLKASGTAQNVLNTLKSKFDVSMPFTFNTNIPYSGMAETEKVNPVQALLSSDDDKDSFIKVFGGELLRDSYNVSVMDSIGADRGVQIRYRKNLVGLEVEEDISDVATKIYPIGSDGLTLSEKYINSPRINDYPYPKTFVHEDNDCKTQAELRASAQRLISKGADLPKINIKADFQLLSRTEEYKNFSILEEVQLGDIVSVINEKMNFSKKAKVILYEWDCLLDKYNQVELGDFIEDITKGVTVGQKAINVANTANTGANLALDKVENLAVVAKTGSYNDLKDKPTDLGGKDGVDGYTPIKGIDYFDGKDGTNGINGKDGTDGYTPIKGIDYFDGKDGTNGINGKDGTDGINGKDGVDGYTPIKGIDYFDGKDGTNGINGKDGTDGINGKDGVDGYTPIKGIDYFDGKDGTNGINGKDGERGDSGITVPLNTFFSMYVKANGDLIAVVADGGTKPPLSIRNGNLIYTI